MTTAQQRRRLLAALAAVEALRAPLLTRADLAPLLQEIVAHIQALAQVDAVQCVVVADEFTPPLRLQIGAGPLTAAEITAVRWGGVVLATIAISPAPPATPALIAPLLQIATESLAEVWQHELLAQRATLQARAALAAELHDAVKQVLPAIRLLAEQAARRVSDDPALAVALLGTIGEAAQQGVEALGLLIGGLRDQAADTDLAAVLGRVCAEAMRLQPTLRCTLAVHAPPLHWASGACVLGIVRNALANVVQHAHAGAVAVSVTHTAEALVVAVADDGVGVTPAAAVAAPGIGNHAGARAGAGWPV